MQNLSQKLSQWSLSFKENFSRLPRSPIFIYQEFYKLVHDLKPSLQIYLKESEVSQLGHWTDLLKKVEEPILALAYGKKEIEDSKIKQLFILGQTLDSIESLSEFFGNISLKARKYELSVDLKSEPFGIYVWDSLSKARLSSCLEHAYNLFNRKPDLISIDRIDAIIEKTTSSLNKIDAVFINRKISPKKQNEYLVQELIGAEDFKLISKDSRWVKI